MLLAPGNYGVDANGTDTSSVPGLPIFNLNGTADAPIIITGPDTGPRPVLFGRSTHNTVRLSGASYVVVRNLEIDSRNLGGAGVAAQGASHHITLENLVIRGVGGSQQQVGIAANGSSAWNWTVRRNVIEGAGTGMYFGNSDGRNPFVAGLIEHNLVKDTIGYNIQVKHQVPWTNPPAGMPVDKTNTIIRHNVFSKTSTVVSADGARPNLLVGDQPASGPGSQNGFEIYGNFFYQNPTEALFQAEGNVAFYSNVLINDAGTAIRIQPHNGSVRDVRVVGNTVVARDTGIALSAGTSAATQLVAGNAVFASAPIQFSGTNASMRDNVTGSRSDATVYLNNPNAGIGALDLHPTQGQLQGPQIADTGLSGHTDAARDFNGATRGGTMRGAYQSTGANPGWLLQLAIKP